MREQLDGERVVTWPFGAESVAFTYEPGDGVVVFSLSADPALELHAETLGDVLADAAPDAFDDVLLRFGNRRRRDEGTSPI